MQDAADLAGLDIANVSRRCLNQQIPHAQARRIRNT